MTFNVQITVLNAGMRLCQDHVGGNQRIHGQSHARS